MTEKKLLWKILNKIVLHLCAININRYIDVSTSVVDCSELLYRYREGSMFLYLYICFLSVISLSVIKLINPDRILRNTTLYPPVFILEKTKGRSLLSTAIWKEIATREVPVHFLRWWVRGNCIRRSLDWISERMFPWNGQALVGAAQGCGEFPIPGGI